MSADEDAQIPFNLNHIIGHYEYYEYYELSREYWITWTPRQENDRKKNIKKQQKIFHPTFQHLPTSSPHKSIHQHLLNLSDQKRAQDT